MPCVLILFFLLITVISHPASFAHVSRLHQLMNEVIQQQHDVQILRFGGHEELSIHNFFQDFLAEKHCCWGQKGWKSISVLYGFKPFVCESGLLLDIGKTFGPKFSRRSGGIDKTTISICMFKSALKCLFLFLLKAPLLNFAIFSVFLLW